MANSLQQMTKLQQAWEVTPGTAITTSTIIRGGITALGYGPMTTVVQPDTRNGSLAAAEDAVPLASELQIEESGYLNFTDFPYLLEAGYHASSPSVAADGGSPIGYTRVYIPTLTAEDTPRTPTFEVGSNTEAFRAAYGYLKSFELSATVKGLTNYKATWGARTPTDLSGAFTGSLSRHRVVRCRAADWVVTIDSTTMGSTPVTACLDAFTYRSGPLWMSDYCIDGTSTFAKLVQQRQQPELDLTLQLNAQTLALLANYQAGDLLYVRLRNTGPVIHDTVHQVITIDLSANVMTYPMVGTSATNGVNTVQVGLKAAQDNGGGSFTSLVKHTVVNTVAVLL